LEKLKVGLSLLEYLHLYVDPVAEMHFFAHYVKNEVDDGEVIVGLVVFHSPN